MTETTMATATFYTYSGEGKEYLGIEIKYPAQYDSYVSHVSMRLYALAEALKPYGIFQRSKGHWSEKGHFSVGQESPWWKTVEIHQSHDIDNEIPTRLVPMEEFVQFIYNRLG